jgi:hypothetical protein
MKGSLRLRHFASRRGCLLESSLRASSKSLIRAARCESSRNVVRIYTEVSSMTAKYCFEAVAWMPKMPLKEFTSTAAAGTRIIKTYRCPSPVLMVPNVQHDQSIRTGTLRHQSPSGQIAPHPRRKHESHGTCLYEKISVGSSIPQKSHVLVASNLQSTMW